MFLRQAVYWQLLMYEINEMEPNEERMIICDRNVIIVKLASKSDVEKQPAGVVGD